MAEALGSCIYSACPNVCTWTSGNKHVYFLSTAKVGDRMNRRIVKMLVAQLCLVLCNPMDCSPLGSSLWNSPGKNTGVGCHSLLRGIFPTQGSNPHLPYCRWILYQLSHNGSPRTLEWVAYPFSSGSSWPRNRTRVCCIAGRFFTNWTIKESLGSPRKSFISLPFLSFLFFLLSSFCVFLYIIIA